MKYAVQMGLSTVTYIPRSCIEKMIRQHGHPISLVLFFKKKESRLIKYSY
jgi:hypothetical protein